MRIYFRIPKIGETAMALGTKSPRKPPNITRAKAPLDPKDSKSSVQSLTKGLRILEAFTSGADERTLSEIAAATGLDAGTTFRMLNTLVGAGYVARIPDSRRFRLSLKVLELGFNAIARTELRALVRPLLQSLVDQVSEAASFAVLDGGDVLYIERIRAGFTRIGIDIQIGTTLHAPVTLIGRTILAFLPNDQLERALATPPRHPTPIQMPARAELDVILEAIRNDGYLVAQSAIAADLRLLAVPVIGADGYATGAISLVAPAIHSSNEDLKARALTMMRTVAQDIARAQEAIGTTSSMPIQKSTAFAVHKQKHLRPQHGVAGE
jgi:IclR family transcriptional regulator, pca regulon regulatory protein